MESVDNSVDNKRIEKSLSLLTRKFVELLLASKNGILDLKVVSIFLLRFCKFIVVVGLGYLFDIFIWKLISLNVIFSLARTGFDIALFGELNLQYGYSSFVRYEIAPFCVMFDVTSNIGAIFDKNRNQEIQWAHFYSHNYFFLPFLHPKINICRSFPL